MISVVNSPEELEYLPLGSIVELRPMLRGRKASFYSSNRLLIRHAVGSSSGHDWFVDGVSCSLKMLSGHEEHVRRAKTRGPSELQTRFPAEVVRWGLTNTSRDPRAEKMDRIARFLWINDFPYLPEDELPEGCEHRYRAMAESFVSVIKEL